MQSGSSQISLLIVDDHPVVREGLTTILGTQPDFLVVGDAADGAEAVDRARELSPDVILMDLEMPGVNGVDALRRLQSEELDIPVIVFTVFDTDERIVEAVREGARGYLLKGAPREEIFRAIRHVHRGESLLEPVIARKLMDQVRHLSEEQERPDSLTPRELEVLQQIASGRTNREIAEILTITERTVKFHVGSILSRLGASNRTEAVSLARSRKILD